MAPSFMSRTERMRRISPVAQPSTAGPGALRAAAHKDARECDGDKWVCVGGGDGDDTRNETMGTGAERGAADDGIARQRCGRKRVEKRNKTHSGRTDRDERGWRRARGRAQWR
ncbi:unnamed protein product [Agarophyton chilense]